MMMMRSNSAKMGKPPPPIPPRPSKALVAEALAKSRRSPVNNRDVETEKAMSPIRSAPPPPFLKDPLVDSGDIKTVIKSQSHSSVNSLNNKSKTTAIQRSTSQNDEEKKDTSRTVVFQSSNLKTSKIEVKLMQNGTVTKNKDEKGIDSSPHEGSNEVVKQDVIRSSSESITEKDKSVNSTINHNQVNKNDSFNRKDSKWNDTLNGKNHVNTLIDEMFASILDIPDTEVHQAFNENVKVSCDIENNEIRVSADKTKIILSNECCDNVITSEVSNQEKLQQPHANTTVLVIDDIKPMQPMNENDSEDLKFDKDEEKSTESRSNSSTTERMEKRVKFDDKKNHELLISELENMRKEQDRIMKRQRKPSLDLYEENNEESSKIQHSDWVEMNDGQEVRLSSCQIIIEDSETNKNIDSVLSDSVLSRLNMSSLHGLPPLPKSLSGFSLLENQRNPQTPNRIMTPPRGVTPPNSGFISGQVVYPPHPRVVNGNPDPPSGRKSTNLDNQLAILRREMYSLRQLDLSLLSQLWSLNESIQDFRQILQDQDDRALSPPSPSPSPSSCDDGEVDEFFTPTPLRLRPAPPPPPLRRTSNSSSANSSEYGTV